MARLDVGAIRAVILVVNLGILVLFGTLSWGFFVGEPDELDLQLPDESRYENRDPKKSTNNRKAENVIGLLFAKKPPPKPVKTKDTGPKEPPKPTGGPLKDWKILNVIQYPTCNMAFVYQGDNPEADPASSVGSSSGSKGKKRRGRPSRRRPRAGAGKTKFESMIEGREFKGVMIDAITKTEVRYSSNGREYSIERDNYERPDFSGGIKGREIDEDDMPTVRGQEVDEEDLGRIDPGTKKSRSKSKDKKKEDAKKAAAEKARLEKAKKFKDRTKAKDK